MQPDMRCWSGRVDPEPDTLRWHQVVKPLSDADAPGIALVGFCCDEGVRRNQGRTGAAEGPRAIRKALGSLACHQSRPVYDVGDVICDDGDLEGAQARLADTVAAALNLGHMPLILGGGHEMAFGSWLGLAQHFEKSADRSVIGVLNFDAHLDLRDPAFIVSSGTPFMQIANACKQRDWPFHYACLGVSRAANTSSLFASAIKHNVHYRLDNAMTVNDLPEIQSELSDFIDRCDQLYMTVCLDVFSAATAPGVSAPSARGVLVEIVESLIDQVRKSGKLAVADIAELNPRLDMDARTARLAARLVHTATL